jgi:hypothetical protein
MWVWLFAMTFSLIHEVRRADISRIPREYHTFLFATSSDSYSYDADLETLAGAVRRCQIQANFLYIDTFTENLTVKDLRVPVFPALIYWPCHEFLRGRFTEDSLVTFFNECSAGNIPHLQTESDLQFFFDACAFGVLASYENASDDTLPALAEIHRNHFNEISFAYCDPALVGRSSFFVYRFLDNTLIELQDSLFNLSQDEVEHVLTGYAIPDIAKADLEMIDFLMPRVSRIAILVLDFHGAFYPSLQQIELAKHITFTASIALCYEPIGLPAITSSVFQFPEISGTEELRIIEKSDSGVWKYRFTESLTPDNTVHFIKKVESGQVDRYWRSAPIPQLSNETIDHLVALNVLDYISDGWSAIGFYDCDEHGIQGMMTAKGKLAGKCKIGAFRLGLNEWPGHEINLNELPRLVMFKNGSVTLNVPLVTSPRQVVAQIVQQINDREL